MELKHIKLITILTIILCVSLAAVSYFGVFRADTYMRDSASMGTQGTGQDIVDLFIVVPLLIISLFSVRNRHRYSAFIFGGILFYIIYSFFIYCFGVHFNNLFLLYCLILGSSLYAFIITVTDLNSTEIQNFFSGKAPLKSVAVYFIIIAAMFYLLWLKDIVPAILGNSVPKSVAGNGLLVNPVHVLDISVVLPGFVITSVLLLKKHKSGFIFAPVLLVFLIILAFALIGMLIMMKIKGINEDISPALIFGILSVISIILLIKYLNCIRLSNDQAAG